MWLTNKIRSRETPFWRWVYTIAKSIRSANVPVIRPLHVFLRNERSLRLMLWEGFKSYFYYEPLFKTMCKECGKGLSLSSGIPQVMGPLDIYIGNNVSLHGVGTFIAGKVYPNPSLYVGDHSHLGYQMGISVGTKIVIGKNVLIANRVALMGYDGHPIDPILRSKNYPPGKSGCGDIIIEDYAWIGANATILKNVTIGKAAIVAAGSVVTKDVPPYTIAAGNPARVVKALDEYKVDHE